MHSISKNLSVSRVVVCLLQSWDIVLSTNMLQLKFQNVKTKEKPYIDLAYSKETCILYTIDI